MNYSFTCCFIRMWKKLVSYRTYGKNTEHCIGKPDFVYKVCSPRERYLKIDAVVSFKATVLAEDHTVSGHSKIPLNLVRSIFLRLALTLLTVCLLFTTMFIEVWWNKNVLETEAYFPVGGVITPVNARIKTQFYIDTQAREVYICVLVISLNWVELNKNHMVFHWGNLSSRRSRLRAFGDYTDNPKSVKRSKAA